MEVKIKNREWVKNAAIVFLAVLLVLTFFSNTIMNRSLPEVATAMVQSGSIVAKVRGSGTVAANGVHQVKAKETRTIRSVMVKTGQEVNAGDVLFVLGEGDETELEQAQEKLRQLEISYQRSAASMPSANFTAQQLTADRAYQKYIEATDALIYAEDRYFNTEESDPEKQAEIERLNASIERLNEEISQLQTDYDIGIAQIMSDDGDYEAKTAELEMYRQMQQIEMEKPKEERQDYTDIITALEYDILALEPNLPQIDGVIYSNSAAYSNIMNAEIDELKAQRDSLQLARDQLNITAGNPTYRDEYEMALKAYQEAEDAYYRADASLQEAYDSYSRSSAVGSIDLRDISEQIAKQKEKIKSLAGEEENVVTANVSGTIDTIDCTAGDTVLKDALMCTIEVPDMGHELSFSVTNDQARRLRVGDTATVSNFYWGNEIKATLSTIRTDPKNPQTNKVLTFDLEGDVTTGSELTISVGQKSANYDLIVPNSSIKSDSNGSFVLAVTAKSSPLGNRYIAKRVSIEVLASDDTNSAVVAELSNGDYVITTGSAPINSGDQVRMADS